MNPSSIFNEVFGPVMVGPSSSHTAGPARIGLMARLMLPDEPAEVKIYFDRRGAYPPTYKGQGTDYGLVGGILGLETGQEDLKNSLTLAGEAGIKVDFIITDIKNPWHPNFVRLKIKTKGGYDLEAEAASTGGGAFRISAYQGYPVSMDGGAHEFLFSRTGPDTEAAARQVFERQQLVYEFKSIPASDGRPELINIKSDRLPSTLLDELETDLGQKVLYLRPVMPVVKKLDGLVPFTTAGEAQAWAEKEKITEPWLLAVTYESAISGHSETEIMGRMKHLIEVMKGSALKALEGGYPQRGFLPPQSPLMHQALSGGQVKQLDLGVLNRAALWSVGVLDYGFCQGVVAAAPTGGSSGVLPGAVLSVAEEMGYSDEEVCRAMLTGGLIGVFIDHGATFAAETCACQAEIGSASAMAAAAVTQLLGGDVRQCFQASALALQNLLGLVCDPVAGYGNVPCINRNASGVANSLVSSNMVLAGFDPFIPLDEVIQAMMSVGQMLPASLRCTGDGGLCQTKTARDLAARLNQG